MNILYMGYFCNEQLFNKLVEQGSGSSHARQHLEDKLLRGLMSTLTTKDSMSIISYLPNILGEKIQGETWNGIEISYLWCNKKNFISVSLILCNNLRNIIKWSRNKEQKIILMYSVNPLHAIPALLLRKIRGYKVVTLCPEVSVYRRTEKKQLVSKISRKLEHFLDNSFDGYIVLTKYMNEVVNLKNNPYMVMEGIADPQFESDREERRREKAILYAGGLYKENGIDILLQAFKKINDTEWELWICGDGELKKEIEEAACSCNKIIYYGLVPNEQVLRLERKASLLINPRLTTNKFTRYSFPSKVMEYMASGTATIITRLEGIPEEYFRYVYVWEDETVSGLYSFLEKLFLEDANVLCQKGRQAQQFVSEYKNISCQGKRMTEFLMSIAEKG